ncbi:metal-dependent hydrolase [Ferrimicrobium sp.]|uniref:metal-dependent hydrolase n=1 Tax=Ferrimicrobium sp. TaxID=2926050 RepID=UPI002607A35A|nr:metal-dependent hydrolase [Ferrimicrobium sp.]
MMGTTHAATGSAIGGGVGLAVFGVHSPIWMVASVATCGAAILPDIDEPGSSVAHEFGFISHGFFWIVNKISGGHRKLTHSLLGLGIISLVLLATGPLASAVAFGILAAGAWRIVVPWFTGLRRLYVFVGIGGGYAFYHFHPFSGFFLIVFLSLGWLTHMAGDFLTSEGIPLLYPSHSRQSLPVFGTTGGKAETFRLVPCGSVFRLTLGQV